MSDKNYIQMTTRIDESVKNEFEKIAKKHDRSMGGELSVIIKDHIKKHKEADSDTEGK